MSESTISHEAQMTLAGLAKRKASDRLRRDGNFSPDAIRRRMRAFAHDRDLPPAEIPGRVNTRSLAAFVEKHNVSCEWLMFGDLRGLLKTVQNAQPAPEIVEAQRREIVQLLLAMPPARRASAIAAVREMIGKGSAA
jgi:hypothetical protein